MITVKGVPAAVYRLYSADDPLLYIGMSVNPEARIREHAVHQPWWSDVDRHTITWFASQEDALQAESECIRAEWPAHNRTHKAGTRVVPGIGLTMSVADARPELAELAKRVRVLRHVVTLSYYGRACASLVPAELGAAIEAAGGVDAALRLLGAG